AEHADGWRAVRSHRGDGAPRGVPAREVARAGRGAPYQPTLGLGGVHAGAGRRRRRPRCPGGVAGRRILRRLEARFPRARRAAGARAARAGRTLAAAQPRRLADDLAAAHVDVNVDVDGDVNVDVDVDGDVNVDVDGDVNVAVNGPR